MPEEEESYMPKVTEAYKLEKRNMIVQTAWEILEHKPLYEMSSPHPNNAHL